MLQRESERELQEKEEEKKKKERKKEEEEGGFRIGVHGDRDREGKRERERIKSKEGEKNVVPFGTHSIQIDRQKWSWRW